MAEASDYLPCLIRMFPPSCCLMSSPTSIGNGAAPLMKELTRDRSYFFRRPLFASNTATGGTRLREETYKPFLIIIHWIEMLVVHWMKPVM